MIEEGGWSVSSLCRPLVKGLKLHVEADTWLYWHEKSLRLEGEVVLLLRRRNGRYLVHTKEFYPRGVYRMPSGGIESGESPAQAAVREAREETGLLVEIVDLLGVVEQEFIRDGCSFSFTSYLFLVKERGGELVPGEPEEGIVGFREVQLGDVVALAEELESLPEGWRDWGRFRATAHRLVGRVMQENYD